MDLLYELKSTLLTILPPSFFDILDIGVLTFLVYKIIKFMMGNRAGGLAKGIGLLVVMYLAAKFFHMKAVSFIFEKAFNIGLITLVILFQPELRRSLENVGHVLGNKKNASGLMWENPINEICIACEYFSNNRIGAIMAIERNDKLEEYMTGTVFKADINARLLESIFYVAPGNTPGAAGYSPLHDCAVIMQDGQISAAGCQLPPPEHPERVNKDFGSRHKAALGMSEKSDAVTIVVSEETGAVRIACKGELTMPLSTDELKNMLTKLLINDNGQNKNKENKAPDVKKKSENSRKEEH